MVISRGEDQLGSLAGRLVLLVEDSTIIALDLEDLLRRDGAADVVVATNLAAGREILAHVAPSVALLDVNLGQETSLPLADALQDRGIPYLFLTGYGDDTALSERHRGAPRLTKPIDRKALMDVLEGLLRG
jgi:DNA-binding NtrC family response regulator